MRRHVKTGMGALVIVCACGRSEVWTALEAAGSTSEDATTGAAADDDDDGDPTRVLEDGGEDDESSAGPPMLEQCEPLVLHTHAERGRALWAGSIAWDPSGDIVLAGGRTEGVGALWLGRLRPDGSLAWENELGTRTGQETIKYSPRIVALVLAPESERIYAAARVQAAGNTWDSWVVALDTDGTMLWERKIAGVALGDLALIGDEALIASVSEISAVDLAAVTFTLDGDPGWTLPTAGDGAGNHALVADAQGFAALTTDGYGESGVAHLDSLGLFASGLVPFHHQTDVDAEHLTVHAQAGAPSQTYFAAGERWIDKPYPDGIYSYAEAWISGLTAEGPSWTWHPGPREYFPGLVAALAVDTAGDVIAVGKQAMEFDGEDFLWVTKLHADGTPVWTCQLDPGPVVDFSLGADGYGVTTTPSADILVVHNVGTDNAQFPHFVVTQLAP